MVLKINSIENNKAINKKITAKKVIKTAAIVTAGAAAISMADLFITKGKVSSAFTKSKESFIKVMSDDIDNVLKLDGYATKSRMEAFLTTPGLHAIWSHRIAHKLEERNIPLIPKMIQNVSRFFTGIEIHPGAELGRNVFIDHTGAIIGQTAKVGNNVTMVGRVVLGSNGKGDEYLRHTIVEDGAMLGMNSVMLGRITIGQNAKVGAGALITHNVPANSTVIGNPAKIISQNGKKLKNPIPLNKIKSL